MTWWGFKMFLRETLPEHDPCEECRAMGAPPECCNICSYAKQMEALCGPLMEQEFFMERVAQNLYEACEDLGIVFCTGNCPMCGAQDCSVRVGAA